MAVIGGVTGGELDAITRRSDPRKAPAVHTGGLFSTNLSSGAAPCAVAILSLALVAPL